jgi:hypothetical protein
MCIGRVLVSVEKRPSDCHGRPWCPLPHQLVFLGIVLCARRAVRSSTYSQELAFPQCRMPYGNSIFELLCF